MTWKTSVLAAIVTGSVGAALYAALPAGAASRSAAPVTATLTAAAIPAPSAAAIPAPSAAAAPTNRCEGREEWPDVANGRPASLDRHDLGGFYLWHGDDGWHLVVTHRGDDRMEFSGYITTDGTLAAQGVLDEKDDHVTVGPRDHTVWFRFANYGGFDGMNFQTHCADTLTVHLLINGHEVTSERVFIGRNKVNPTSVPFTIERDGIH